MQLHEDAIIEGLEHMCDPEHEAGEWLIKMDIVEEGDQLKLVDMEQVRVSRQGFEEELCHSLLDEQRLKLVDMEQMRASSLISLIVNKVVVVS